MKVKIKKLIEEAIIPKYAKPGDAGLDLTATSKSYDNATRTVKYGTGLAIEIPEGYVGLIFPRSSIYKVNLAMTNCVGVIDSGYRGELGVIFREGEYFEQDAFNNMEYEVGDRIAQLIIIPYPQVELEEVKELTDSSRGASGWGSSGK